MFEQIPPPMFIAVGTIAAAIISGAIAFLNLIISKEQSVSEFRQRWIDALREELADFLSAATSISVHSQIAFDKKEQTSLEEAVAPLHEPIGRLYTTYHRIMLRLNPEEHQELSSKINALEKAISNPKLLADPKTFGYMCADVNTEAQGMLKKEWTRVKHGENVYRIVKAFSAATFGAAVLTAGLIIVEYVGSIS